MPDVMRVLKAPHRRIAVDSSWLAELLAVRVLREPCEGVRVRLLAEPLQVICDLPTSCLEGLPLQWKTRGEIVQ